MHFVSPESEPSFSLPVLGMGTYHLLDRVSEEDAIEALHRAQEHGIELIDTSDNYMSEAVIGRAIESSQHPEQFIIATKTGLATTREEFLSMHAEGRKYDTSPERIWRQLRSSLNLLSLSSVDLYQLHVHDPQTPTQSVVETMGQIVEGNYAAYWGISNYRLEAIEELLSVCDEKGVKRPVTLQPFYNLLSGAHTDREVELARREGMVILAHSPLVKGLLADNMLDKIDALLEFAENKPQSNHENITKFRYALDQIKRMRAYAHAHGYTLSEYAIAWLVNQPATVVLNACVSQEHVESSVKAIDWQLDEEGLKLAQEVRDDEVVRSVVPLFMNFADSTKPYYAKRTA